MHNRLYNRLQSVNGLIFSDSTTTCTQINVSIGLHQRRRHTIIVPFSSQTKPTRRSQPKVKQKKKTSNILLFLLYFGVIQSFTAVISNIVSLFLLYCKTQRAKGYMYRLFSVTRCVCVYFSCHFTCATLTSPCRSARFLAPNPGDATSVG